MDFDFLSSSREMKQLQASETMSSEQRAEARNEAVSLARQELSNAVAGLRAVRKTAIRIARRVQRLRDAEVVKAPRWIVDLESCQHSSSEQQDFTELRAIEPIEIEMANANRPIIATGIGTAKFYLGNRSLILENCYFTPDAPRRIISAPVLAGEDVRISATRKRCCFKVKNGEFKLPGRQRGARLFRIECSCAACIKYAEKR